MSWLLVTTVTSVRKWKYTQKMFYDVNRAFKLAKQHGRLLTETVSGAKAGKWQMANFETSLTFLSLNQLFISYRFTPNHEFIFGNWTYFCTPFCGPSVGKILKLSLSLMHSLWKEFHDEILIEWNNLLTLNFTLSEALQLTLGFTRLNNIIGKRTIKHITSFQTLLSGRNPHVFGQFPYLDTLTTTNAPSPPPSSSLFHCFRSYYFTFSFQISTWCKLFLKRKRA